MAGTDKRLKVLLTGGKGMLGRTLVKVLGCDYEVVPTDLPEADITDEDCIDRVLAEHSPDVVIHCAAMTAVDKCESERDLAFRLNARGTANVAASCNRHGIRLIAISTDYVFEGDSTEPYDEFDIPTGGRTVYGQSKFAGERAVESLCPNHVICRISWLYGSGGPSFVHTMLKLGAQAGDPLKVVNDQFGNPTSTDVVADVIRFLLTKPEVSGIVHGTCEDQCSWYDFACEIKRLTPGFTRAVVPCTTAEFPRPAPRPRCSALKKSVLNVLGYRTPTWQAALAAFLASSANGNTGR